MNIQDIRQKINFKQPKYMIPALIYLPLLFTLYMVCDMFSFTPEEKDNGLETTEYLNSKLPDANIKGDGINGKYEAMLDNYGKIRDKTVVKDAGEDSLQHENYDSKYKDAEVGALDESSNEHAEAVRHLQQLREEIRQQQQAELLAASEEEDRSGGNTPEEDKTIAELQDALKKAQEEAEGAGAKATDGVRNTTTEVMNEAQNTNKKASHNPADVVKAPTEDAPTLEVVKKQKKESDFFNTISSNEKQQKLIKAIIDEDIKAKEGSRVRLRLLDELEVGGHTLPAGSYLYAIMSGFGSQRVKGTVSSVLVEEEILKINLSIYDTDGLEGLYIPESNFREVGKDVAAGALQGGGNNFFDSSAPSTFVQMGYQAIQNGYNKITNAISKAIRKNTAKLKYGTQVYLINSQGQKSNQRRQQAPVATPEQQQQAAREAYSRYMMNVRTPNQNNK